MWPYSSLEHSWFGGTSLPRRRQKGVFEDIVEERRCNGELGWIVRRRNHVPRLHTGSGQKLNPEAVKAAVLASDRLRYGVRELLEEEPSCGGATADSMMHEAAQILDEMGHALSMRAIRIIGYVLMKALKRIFRGVFVNREGIVRLRAAIREYPVLLMPMHRSYADFLLISIICYDYDLPLPVIAAAMDFMGMRFVGELLRRCGAFFIRRSFASDKLYWLVFAEYVKQHVRHGLAPVEFFIEGTRSRTNKSLTPKTGMLGAILEAFFTGEVPDVYLVPISISYERLLEEKLYGYELLGIPKPKESTSGLLKARSILGDNYGNVHIYFDDPVSLRELAARWNSDSRVLHGLQPKVKAGLHEAEYVFLRKVARFIIERQMLHVTLSVWLLCVVELLQLKFGQELSLDVLSERVQWLHRIFAAMGADVDWPTEVPRPPVEVILRDALAPHANLLLVFKTTQGSELVRLFTPQEVDTSGDLLLTAAALRLQLASYRNHCSHLFLREGILAILLSSAGSSTSSSSSVSSFAKKDLLFKYDLLDRELLYDFPFLESQSSSKNASDALDNLVALEAVTSSDICVQVCYNKEAACSVLEFMASIARPFLIGHWFVAQCVREAPGILAEISQIDVRSGSVTKILTRKIQNMALTALRKHFVASNGQEFEPWLLETLSLDLLSNAISGLLKSQSLIWKNGQLRADNALLVPLLETLHGALFHCNKTVDPFLEAFQNVYVHSPGYFHSKL